MGDFLRFQTMITPIVVQILFWIAVAGCVIGGIVAIAGGEVKGILVIILGPIAARIYAEILILFFRINDHLRQIEHNTTR
ncbi:MAG TPA: DUF4282 domain-containing protein [Stellaceae bacterium]|nr:DUF4282 domain-containing protein [Stellaceae bacterium]